jgi:hypothetical protein
MKVSRFQSICFQLLMIIIIIKFKQNHANERRWKRYQYFYQAKRKVMLCRHDHRSRNDFFLPQCLTFFLFKKKTVNGRSVQVEYLFPYATSTLLHPLSCVELSFVVCFFLLPSVQPPPFGFLRIGCVCSVFNFAI